MPRKLLSVFFALLFFFSCSAFADSQSEVELLNSICAEKHLSLHKALEQMNGREFQTPQLVELSRVCNALSMCEGLFIQESSSGKGKVYTATVEFYLSGGIPYCSLDYTNYGGTLDDAPVEYSDDTGYTFVSHPEGSFYNRTHTFTVLFTEETLRISWGDSNDYLLSRSSGAVSEYTSESIPFEDREIYQTIVGVFKKMLGDVDHHCVYDEEENTLYVYIAMGKSLRALLLTDGARMESKWNSILEGFLDITDRIAAAITLDIRDGIGDFTQAHCTVMIVDELNNHDDYAEQDAIAIIKDGEITFDLLKDASGNNSNQIANSVRSDHTPTTGERNALRSAKQYLDIMAFSRSGLLDQLKYEGYSQKEAEYAVTYCEADWNEQAAKSAANYLSLMAFSRSGLIEQLEYDGFTHEQAVYGVMQNGY